MKLNGTRLTLAFLGVAVLAAAAGFAQQQPNTSDQYQGVSQPPPDDLIVATPDTPPPSPARAARPKPSPAIAEPAPTPPASTSNTVSAAASRYVNSGAPATTTSPANDTHRWDNTDYGIVTVPLAPGEDDPGAPPSDDTAVLRIRENPAALAARSGPSNELPVGSQIRIRVDEALSTSDTALDAPFHGKVVVNVIHDGSVIIPAGSMLRGHVVQVSQGHHFGPAASLRLRPDVVILPDGTAYHLYGEVAYSNADNTQIGDEGAIQPDSHAVKKTVEYGAGVGTGAIVGAAIAGPPGALAGTIVGAGLVTTHLLMQHPDAASIPAGSEVTFSLTEPLYLIPTRN